MTLLPAQFEPKGSASGAAPGHASFHERSPQRHESGAVGGVSATIADAANAAADVSRLAIQELPAPSTARSAFWFPIQIGVAPLIAILAVLAAPRLTGSRGNASAGVQRFADVSLKETGPNDIGLWRCLVDLGTVKPGATKLFETNVVNRTSMPIELSTMSVSCGCIKPVIGWRTLPVGDSRIVRLGFHVPEREGLVDGHCDFEFENGKRLRISFSGNACGSLSARPALVSIPVVSGAIANVSPVVTVDDYHDDEKPRVTIEPHVSWLTASCEPAPPSAAAGGPVPVKSWRCCLVIAPSVDRGTSPFSTTVKFGDSTDSGESASVKVQLVERSRFTAYPGELMISDADSSAELSHKIVIVAAVDPAETLTDVTAVLDAAESVIPLEAVHATKLSDRAIRLTVSGLATAMSQVENTGSSQARLRLQLGSSEREVIVPLNDHRKGVSQAASLR